MSDIRIESENIVYGPSPDYEKLWDTLFERKEPLEAARDKSIYFTILHGWDNSHALVVTNQSSNAHMSQTFWDYFTRALRKPRHIDVSKAEITFPEQNVVLNIHNLLYTATHHDVVIADHGRLVWEYFKSGLFLRKTKGTISVEYTPSGKMLADGLTKVLSNAAFNAFVQQLGLVDVSDRLRPQRQLDNITDTVTTLLSEVGITS